MILAVRSADSFVTCTCIRHCILYAVNYYAHVQLFDVLSEENPALQCLASIKLCHGRFLILISGKTATVARIFRPFMPSSIKTQDIKVIFVRFLHVCVSLFLHFVKTGTPPGQQAKFWDCPGQTGTVGNYDTLFLIMYSCYYVII